MKIHTPAFVIGLLVFVVPFVGLPSLVETIVIAAFGIAIMVVTTTFNRVPDNAGNQSINVDATKTQSPQN